MNTPIKSHIEDQIKTIIQSHFAVDAMVELVRPESEHGDFATNVALQLTKELGKPPRDIAETIKQSLEANHNELIQSVEVAGPGFINIRLTDTGLWQLAASGSQPSMAGKTVLVEYSDPNPLKPLHAGHLYTTLVGDSIARLVERAGAKTIRLNYGGDVGLHVGKSLWAIVKKLGGEDPSGLGEIAEAERSSWLGQRYVEGNDAYETDSAAKAEIVETNKRVYELQSSGDKTSGLAQIYWTCRQWSYDYFATLYKQLDVVPFDRFIPESEVTPLGLKTVQEQTERGIFEKSDGAIIFPESKSGLHTRVFINSEGLPTYETKDVGLSLTKWRDYHFDKSIIITANEQAQYMQVVVAAIKQFEPEPAEKTEHITHGVVKLQGGVKMSSRKGNVVSALDILDSARAAGQASDTQPSEETILAAVKYAFARVRIGQDIVYDPTESIALEGNSGPYLQYAHARARSILAKADLTEDVDKSQPLQPDERRLLQKISQYHEVVDKATFERMPHNICTYLYELAQVFNRFYENNRVIGDDRSNIRLAIAQSYADTLKDGLGLLGIEAPNHM